MSDVDDDPAEDLRAAVLDALTRALDEPAAVLGTVADDVVAVFEGAEGRRAVDDMMNRTRIRAMDFRRGAAEIDLESAYEVTGAFVAAARTVLGGAENYSETKYGFTVKAAESPEAYVLAVQRAGRLTPHQARLNAEAERDALLAQLGQARSFRLAEPRSAVDPQVHTPQRIAAYLVARGWEPWSQKDRYWIGGEAVHGEQALVFVPPKATASDYAKRVGFLVKDLADEYGQGELQVLADIAAVPDD